MTHDDATKLIADARSKSPKVTLAQFADALEAVMLERIDILARCSQKIDAQRKIADDIRISAAQDATTRELAQREATAAREEARAARAELAALSSDLAKADTETIVITDEDPV